MRETNGEEFLHEKNTFSSLLTKKICFSFTQESLKTVQFSLNQNYHISPSFSRPHT